MTNSWHINTYNAIHGDNDHREFVGVYKMKRQKILNKDEFHALDRRYLDAKIRFDLVQENGEYVELEQKILDTGKVYKQLVDYMSANQNRNDGKCMVEFTELLNSIKRPATLDEATFLNMLSAALLFYKDAKGHKRLSQYDIRTHHSFQIHKQKCHSLKQITDTSILKGINRKFNQKWSHAFQVRFVDGGREYYFGNEKKPEPVTKNHYLIVRPNMSKSLGVDGIKWEIVLKYYHPCGFDRDEYHYDLDHIDAKSIPKKIKKFGK